MTLTQDRATTTPPGGPAPTPSVPGRLRRHRAKIVVGLALVLATTFAVIGGSGRGHTAALDPDNADPGGARAVARVLEDQGIEVDVVRDAKAFARARVDAGTTVLVTSTDNLGRSTARQVLARRGAAALVLVDPSTNVAALFGSEGGIGYSSSKTVPAACGDERFDGLRLETRTGRVFPAAGGACFALGGGALVTEPASGLYLLGSADLLANEQITSADNAAIALRFLGSRPHLVWYVPDLADQSGSDGVTFSSLLPTWLGPALVLLGVCVVGLMYWRGRRFGPLAVEPLPVAVTAIETTRSRGRLYRKANDRGHAAAALRREARTRLAAHLLLPRTAAEDTTALVNAATPHTALDPVRVRDLLDPGAAAPRTDKDLITLAADLAALIREVRRS